MCWSSWATPQSTCVSLLKNFSLVENHWDLNFWGWLSCFVSSFTNCYIRAIHKTRDLTSLGRYPKGMWSEIWKQDMTLLSARDTNVILNNPFSISVPHISSKERKIVVVLCLEIPLFRGHCIYACMSNIFGCLVFQPVLAFWTSIWRREPRWGLHLGGYIRC